MERGDSPGPGQVKSGYHRVLRFLEQRSVLLCLIAQAALLFYRLDLLPVWGDELFTMETSALPLSGIVERVRVDIHPPLYYFLVHYWLAIPWPAAAIIKVRAFSGLWTLAGTLLLRRLWSPGPRFFLLWALSPCLILYGRMGRSYTMQLFLASLTIYWGLRVIRAPGCRRAQWIYAGCGAALLYTHYLPAAAIVAAVGAMLLYRRAWTAAALPAAVMALAYAPWLLNMRAAFGRVLHSEPYAVTGNAALDQAIRLLYLPVSFTFGESLPLWVMAGGVVLAPALAVAIWRALRPAPDWLPLVGLAAAIGYLGASRWVAFAFIPARLLFALPFYLMPAARRAWSCAALVCLWSGSLYSYFHLEDFLNKGYVLPFDRIAEIIERESAGRSASLMLDAPGLDASPLTHRLPELVRGRGDAEVVWVLSTRGRRTGPAGRREIRSQEFVAYSAFDRRVMQLLDWPTQPTHALELTEYR
ncbi:MAG TPA: hypothetical protein VL285_16380 [Bryobacteraceae bacterium]|nr:hypothetical protein [Bryobacteraceae bacterium]